MLPSYAAPAAATSLPCRRCPWDEVAGTPVFDFRDGWTINTSVDNFLARLVSPVLAIGVFVLADSESGNEETI